MSGNLRHQRNPSKTATRSDEGRFPHPCGWFSSTALQLKQIFSQNCAAEVAHRSGRSVSVVERWLSGKGAPDGKALATLLRSDIGDLVHEALIASVKSPWADNIRAVREIAKLRQQQADTSRRLEALEGNIR
jgi:DNA-binding transcriptional regulator YiaG